MNLNYRPHSLAEVARRADDERTFGWELQDWLHHVRRIRSRNGLGPTITEPPRLLAHRFAQGDVADAWLAAYAEHLANQADLPIPDWALESSRKAKDPWFSVSSPGERLLALRDSPAPFKNRNLFTPRVDLPLNLRPGRPRVSAEHKRQKNAERQRRFRRRRAEELHRLRTAQAAVADL